MKIASAKAKGNLLEDFIVDWLRNSKLDTRAYRQKGSGSGLNKGDIWNSLNIHFECKNQKQASFKEWFRQIEEENVSNLPAALIWHLPQTALENSKVVIDLWFFEKLLQHYREKRTVETPNKEIKYLLERIKTDAHQLIKKLED
jgi:hypothetical protein